MKKIEFRIISPLQSESPCSSLSQENSISPLIYFLHFVMNIVFPFVMTLASILHRISSTTQKNSEPIEESHLWSQCHDDLGCVNNTEEWYDPVHRPIKDRALPREIIKTTFILFNKGEGPKLGKVTIEPLYPIGKQIRTTKFDEKRPKTCLLIHDFTSNGMTGWIKHAVKSLLEINAGNIISVDWTGGAEPPYSIAVQNARFVALEVANLVETLLNEFDGISPEKFHLIGQGVGAHIAGYVGQKINGIGRITGLDPVGLFFKDMPPSTRLDPQDAKFVDIINTDISTSNDEEGQGSGDLWGHSNFFPNGGMAQSGCNETSLYQNLGEIGRGMLREDQTAPGCNHKRAAKYFTASIDERNEECATLMGYACSDYPAFKRGECITDCTEGSGSCSPMGYSADAVFPDNLYTGLASATKFFLDTNYYHPYCLFAYKITIALAEGDESLEPTVQNTTRVKKASGVFCATVYSSSDDEEVQVMFRANLNLGISRKDSLNFEGENVFLTYQKPPRIANPKKILLRFDSENNETIGDIALYVKHVEISNLPDYGNSMTRLCGRERITVLKNRADQPSEFNRCDENDFLDREPGVSSVLAFRQRRNPEGKSIPSQTLDVSDYDESEPPEPAEDDYYSNR